VTECACCWPSFKTVLSDFPDVELGAIRGGNVDATDHLEGFL
jgi:hypothetical protein